MPGVVSLQAVQYYANPRNAFWRIMAELFGLDHEAAYDERVSQIASKPVILWDTLKSCHRPGSLDSKIDRSSAEANDFSALLGRFPGVKAILFNGATSEKYFKLLALPTLPESHRLELLRMPSTSPANAGMKFEEKLDCWRGLLRFL
jgi:hypoxanthine-DNA glycosylase